MVEMLKLKFNGYHSLPDENMEHYDSERDERIASFIDEIKGFSLSRLPEDGTAVTFVKGDEEGPYYAKHGRAEETLDELKRWMTAVYDVFMDCYGEMSAHSNIFESIAVVKWSDFHGQFSVEVYVGGDDDVVPNFTFNVCETSEEAM